MIEALITTAPVVNKIGVVLTAPASMIACLMGFHHSIGISIKSINKTEFRTITPANTNHSINEVAVKTPLTSNDLTQWTNESGMATIITIGVLKF